MLRSTPAEVAAGMDGILRPAGDGRWEALLPSPCPQNHAAFLFRGKAGLACTWFGGSLEGRSDISIYRSVLGQGRWVEPEQISDDLVRSEQNPVEFEAPDGRTLIFHTAQHGGDQHACIIKMRVAGKAPVTLPLPPGSFTRAPVHLRHDGAWLLPLFRCVTEPGHRWNGSHDLAVLAISKDAGKTWRQVEVPNSTGSVHMTLVPLGDRRLAAFYRRRQADFVHRSVSEDDGESWSPPVPTDVPNNNASIAVIRLRDNRIALACNPVNAAMRADRRASLYDELSADSSPDVAKEPGSDPAGGCHPIWGVPRAPMALCLSTDEGLTFPQRLVVEDGPGTCLTNNSLDGRNHELSYPSLVEDDDGMIDLIYTWHRRAIRHVRLSPKWLASA